MFVHGKLLGGRRAEKADNVFYEQFFGLRRKIDKLCEPTKSGNRYSIDPQNIRLAARARARNGSRARTKQRARKNKQPLEL